MAGPAIGGLVVAAGGTVAALLVNCGLFAAIALDPGHDRAARRARDDEDRERTAPGRLRAAIAHVAAGPARCAGCCSCRPSGWSCFTISIPVEVVFAQHSLHAGAGGYGALLSGWGAGAVAGSAVYARWRRAAGAGADRGQRRAARPAASA